MRARARTVLAATLIDGRDPGGSALDGAHACNGVLTMDSREPRATQGGELRLTVGHPSNFFDNEHGEIFGGGVLQRRLLG